jgi:hypothetical protein
MRMDINYLSEVKNRETIELWSALIPAAEGQDGGHAFAVEGRRPGSGQAAFRAELRLGAPGG